MIPTSKGNFVLRVGRYMYSSNWNRQKEADRRRRWYCSQRKKYSCQAVVTTACVSIGRSQKGQMRLSCGGYTFVLPHHYRQSLCKRWYCSTDRPKGCKAFVVTKFEEIISMNNNHNHAARIPRPNPPMNLFHKLYYTRSQRGNKLIYINGYAYYSYRVTGAKERWKCTNHLCGAFMMIIGDQVVKFVAKHNHDANFKLKANVWKAKLQWSK